MVEDVRLRECPDSLGPRGWECAWTSIVEYAGSDMSLRFPCAESRSLVAHFTQQTFEVRIER